MVDLPLGRPAMVLVSGGLALLLSLACPWWLQLDGLPPNWLVLWLLPWAVVEGSLAGALAGLVLGSLHDSLQASGLTAVPALVLLGLWWGRFDSARRPLERSTTLGLLAILGSLGVNLGYALQLQLRGGGPLPVLHITLAQSLLTGLLAPPVCSLFVLIWRRRSTRHAR